MSEKELHLYIDDSGSRYPDKEPNLKRNDEMDCFALGGILVNLEDYDFVLNSYDTFCADQKINYPLHSWAIRGMRKKFGWLKNKDSAKSFHSALQNFLLSLPVLGIAAVINRQGYYNRYKTTYEERLWLMCKTAYCILIERAVKHAQRENRKLRVFFEESGKREDRDLIGYAKSLKQSGMPFDNVNSGPYSALTAKDFQETILGEPQRRSKQAPMVQLADLFVYPMAKAGYTREYHPFNVLFNNGKIIDSVLPPDDRPTLGIKYSCFT